MINRDDLNFLNNIHQRRHSVSIESHYKLKDIFNHETSWTVYKEFESVFKQSTRMIKKDIHIFSNKSEVEYRHYFKSLEKFHSNENYENDHEIENHNSYNSPEIYFESVLHHLKLLESAVKTGTTKWTSYAKLYNLDVADELQSVQDLLNEYKNNLINKTAPLHEVMYNIANYKKVLSDLIYRRDHLDIDKEDVIKNIDKTYNMIRTIVVESGVVEKYKDIPLVDIISLDKSYALLDKVLENFESIYTKGKLVNKNNFTKAEDYVDNLMIKNTTVGFLNHKTKEHEIMFDYVCEHGKLRNIKVFNDYSMAIEDKNGNHKSVFSSEEGSKYVHSVVRADIASRLYKTPKIADAYLKIHDNNQDSFINLYLSIDTFLENHQILKANDFNIIEELKKIREMEISVPKLFEALDDNMNKIVHEHKLRQYAHSISSNKYLHLYDESTYKIIGSLYDLGISTAALQDNIGKKIATFRQPDDLNSALKFFLTTVDSFTLDQVKFRASQVGAQLVMEEDNKVLIKVEDFKESKAMGSPAWCICREEQYFKSYVGNYNHQYFLFDFNKTSDDNNSMIGITVTPDLTCEAAHIRNDDAYYDDVGIEKLLECIGKYDPSWYRAALEEKKKTTLNLGSSI